MAVRRARVIYPGKLGKKIRWKEIEEFVRMSQANPEEAAQTFFKRKYQEALTLLFQHYGRKTTRDEFPGLILDLAVDNVPAFQVELPRGRRKKQYEWNSREALKRLFKRKGWVRRGPKGKTSRDPKSPLANQHPLQLFRTINEEMSRKSYHGYGAAKRTIDERLDEEAIALSKVKHQYRKTHSRKVQKVYSLMKQRSSKPKSP